MDDNAGDDKAAVDAAAVARVAGGDAVALRELHDRYGKVIYSFAYRLTHDATLSEECVQDVFVALWRRAADFDPTRAKLTTWLFVVARNRAIELGRQKSRRPELRDDLEPVGSSPDPAHLVTVADESQRVAEAMAELPEDQLAVLRLSYFDGLSHSEIAEVIGIPLGTVKGRMRLALERLRSLSDTYDLQAES
ncbi:MAG: sigma-70 family RNA polymerase sigma factor [Thermoleophilia bacterium]|nr:sigma-70 family RNA polymerase sigma factor [Thermoleophilia bacterium]